MSLPIPIHEGAYHLEGASEYFEQNRSRIAAMPQENAATASPQTRPRLPNGSDSRINLWEARKKKQIVRVNFIKQE